MLLIFIFVTNNLNFFKKCTPTNHSDGNSLSFDYYNHLTDFYDFKIYTAEMHSIDFKKFSSFKNSFTFTRAREANQKVFAFLFLDILHFIIKIKGMLHHFSIIIYLVMFRIVIFQFDLRVTPSQALKSCPQKYLFSSEVIKNIDHLQKNILRADIEQFTIRRLNNNKNSLYYVYLVLLSGDVNLNPSLTVTSNDPTHGTSNDI